MRPILLLAAGMMLTADVASGQATPAPGRAASDKLAPEKAAPGKPVAGKGVPAAPAKPAGKKADEPRPTQQDIQKLFDAGDYNGALQQVTRVLPLKGDAGAAYDRYTLLMLKAEAHLRLKQFKSAGDTFGAAAKETKDETEAATARATQRVLREAKNGKVQRKSPPERDDKVTTADLLDPDQRENALRIVHADLRAATMPKVKAALRERTLPPISEAFERLGEVTDLELAVKGTDAELLAMRQELAERATGLIGKELARLEKDVAEIRASAETVVKEVYSSSVTGGMQQQQQPGGVGVVGGAGPNIGAQQRGGPVAEDATKIFYRGLSGNDKADLRTALNTSKKIVTTLDALARASGGGVPDADDMVTRAKEVGRAAERTLAARY